MGKISIFNYEAYYLDFLEGNLSQEDTALLMGFLSDHPECRLADDELPVFNVDEMKLEDKSFLKMTDDDDSIVMSNLDHFLIADAEGVITAEKQIELERFIEQHPEKAHDRELYRKVYFEADESVRFGETSSLKQNRKIVLWPYVSGVAAAVLAAVFFVYQPGSSPVIIAENPILIEGGDSSETEMKVENNDKLRNTNFVAQSEDNSEIEKTPVNFVPQNERTPVVKNSIPKIDKTDENRKMLEKSPVRPIVAVFDDQPLKPVTKIENNPVPEKHKTSDYAYTDFKDMRNPIEPITKLISEKTKTDIDFRQEKSARAQGFYVKIGKFEISRKKH